MVRKVTSLFLIAGAWARTFSPPPTAPRMPFTAATADLALAQKGSPAGSAPAGLFLLPPWALNLVVQIFARVGIAAVAGRGNVGQRIGVHRRLRSLG